MGTAWSLTGTLVSGLLVWGGVGYVLDKAAGFHWLFLPIGMVIGIATGIYGVYPWFERDDAQA
jgi:F0F1-type ATP synthase assembly protein I